MMSGKGNTEDFPTHPSHPLEECLSIGLELYSPWELSNGSRTNLSSPITMKIKNQFMNLFAAIYDLQKLAHPIDI